MLLVDKANPFIINVVPVRLKDGEPGFSRGSRPDPLRIDPGTVQAGLSQHARVIGLLLDTHAQHVSATPVTVPPVGHTESEFEAVMAAVTHNAHVANPAMVIDPIAYNVQMVLDFAQNDLATLLDVGTALSQVQRLVASGLLEEQRAALDHCIHVLQAHRGATLMPSSTVQ